MGGPSCSEGIKVPGEMLASREQGKPRSVSTATLYTAWPHSSYKPGVRLTLESRGVTLVGYIGARGDTFVRTAPEPAARFPDIPPRGVETDAERLPVV